MISEKLFPTIIFIHFFQCVSERNLNYFSFWQFFYISLKNVRLVGLERVVSVHNRTQLWCPVNRTLWSQDLSFFINVFIPILSEDFNFFCENQTFSLTEIGWLYLFRFFISYEYFILDSSWFLGLLLFTDPHTSNHNSISVYTLF